MNTKANAFSKMLKEEKLDAMFEMQEIKDDELNTVLYNTSVKVDGKNLPFVLAIDDSICSLFRILLADVVINDKNRTAALECVNELNGMTRTFRYYIDGQNNMVLDCPLPANDLHFDPALVRVMINTAIQHLEANYAETLKRLGLKE